MHIIYENKHPVIGEIVHRDINTKSYKLCKSYVIIIPLNGIFTFRIIPECLNMNTGAIQYIEKIEQSNLYKINVDVVNYTYYNGKMPQAIMKYFETILIVDNDVDVDVFMTFYDELNKLCSINDVLLHNVYFNN